MVGLQKELDHIREEVSIFVDYGQNVKTWCRDSIKIVELSLRKYRISYQ